MGRTYGMRLRWRPAQSTEPEWVDLPGHPAEVIAHNLTDLRRVNRLLGGVRLTLRPLFWLAGRVPGASPLRVLDVATGGADIPRAMVRRAAAAGQPVSVVASDIAEAIVLAARAQAPVPPSLSFLVADARRLPFADGAFHVTTASLALHHMFPSEAVVMLREMARSAAVGVVVNDIVRSWLTYFGAILASRLGSRNVLTHHDGPLSALRAYTTAEMADLARAAGLRPVRWESFLFYRVSFAARPCRA
jgi:2-polyprenyl-3-methyl-5-hydroxy-6-metoxy-1,4-benzoquinol methylase